tara:strand:+ start:2355 stop:3110 length:756 start_codon:yes stop_codon:yes gene_type:complete
MVKKLIWMMNNKKSNVRINKYLSEIGHCSRRQADKLIEQGRVEVGGEIVKLGFKVSFKDSIYIDGKLINSDKRKPIYIAFNKPVGIVCTTNTKVEKNNIIDFIDFPSRIFPIGRLDKSSQGLIFLTNDGDIVNKILRARNKHEKEYIVVVNKPVTDHFISKMSQGVPVLETITRPCIVKQLHKNKFKIILTQGLNRQIRRMCEYLDYRVKSLKRTRIMNVNLDIDVGKWRHLSDKEIKKINDLVSESSKTN